MSRLDNGQENKIPEDNRSQKKKKSSSEADSGLSSSENSYNATTAVEKSAPIKEKGTDGRAVFRAPKGTSFQGRYSKFAQSKNIWQGWTGSLIIHLLFLLIIAVVISQVPKGQGGVQDKPGVVVAGEIVVVNTDKNEADKPFLDESDFQDPTEPESEQDPVSVAAAATRQNLQELLPNDLPGLTKSENTFETDGRALEGLTGDDLKGLKDTVKNASSIGESKIQFGGLVGTGTRFVFVVDRSTSMDSSSLINAAKAELVASIESLPEHHQFQVIFYNDTTKFYRRNGGVNRLWFGTKSNKRSVFGFIKRTKTAGGTKHRQALASALELEPDVVFLLTDADNGLRKSEQNELLRINRAGTSINVIAFGASGEPTRDILTFRGFARKTGGQFQYKTIQSLMGR